MTATLLLLVGAASPASASHSREHVADLIVAIECRPGTVHGDAICFVGNAGDGVGPIVGFVRNLTDDAGDIVRDHVGPHVDIVVGIVLGIVGVVSDGVRESCESAFDSLGSRCPVRDDVTFPTLA